MHIFILEDDIIQQKRLENIVQTLATKNHITYKQIYTTKRPRDLLKKIDETATHRLYFLDIEIKNSEQNGLDVAKCIREKDPYGTIVFTTSYTKLAARTFFYKVAATDFIGKDQPEGFFEKRIEECLLIADDYHKRTLPLSGDTFSFENKYTSFQVPYSDVLYFETTGTPHKIKLVTTTRTIDFYGRFNSMADSDNRLFRCHQSFVVNLENVVKIDKTNKLVIFKNGSSCFISRRKLKEALNLYQEYHSNN